ncbi:helix-turn-helix domain-containing protein [Proteiniphilum sp. X52]|uniref:helix-turn-helix domain-containing protein n=1 Tax=Proteiniphilum sp. X52 TaxID=2382159 RepID=UPI001314C2E3|nr:helix-turn-helix domain-containing protein [Proteiniphilum sp. X52]
MIYSRSTYNRIIALLLIIVGLVIIVLSIVLINGYNAAKTKMERDIPPLFEHAINEEVLLKMEGEYVSIHIVDPFTTKERVRDQKIVTEDTTITKVAEVSGNTEKELLKGFQSYLLHVNRLKPDTLQQLFDKKLDEKGIKARSLILVCHGNNTELSEDTMGYRINSRTPIIKGGVFGEISYQGLVNYSPLTVFRLIPKNAIIALFILEVLILGVVYYLYLGKRKIRPDKIVKKGRYYYIGKTMLDTRKNELIGQKKITKIPNQPANILLMFLESDDYTLLKEEIKEKFWSDKYYTANRILMSTMSKLRNCLKEAGCTYNIHTKKGDGCYILKYMEKNAEANEADVK